MLPSHLFTLGIAALALASPIEREDHGHISIPSRASRSPVLAATQLEQLAAFALGVARENVPSHNPHHKQGCTKETLHVRRNWRAFSTPEKKAYIGSVLCLQQKPARTPSHLAPGARTRYDDFVATHINQTLQIHYTVCAAHERYGFSQTNLGAMKLKGTFLAWHRNFIHEFEQALRDECGYTGDYPYWDWGADANNMPKSPVFDGSSTSMSGNGIHIPNEASFQLTLGDYPPVTLPPGTGGGCVASGPFKNYTVNLGPAALVLPGGNVSAVENPLDYNPRCFKRDLTTAILHRYANYTSIVSLILENDNIWDFEMTMQGVPGSGTIGVHGGGHYSMGGDPGRDIYVSPGDPAFWHHHGMIDRVWWIWQNLDIGRRGKAISGTGTFLNEPPSANTTLDTLVDAGYANGEPIAMKDIMSTTAGPFCYVYV